MKSSKDTGINWARAIPGLGTLIDLHRTVNVGHATNGDEKSWNRLDTNRLFFSLLMGIITGCAESPPSEQEEPIPTRVGITPRGLESPVPERDPIPYLVDLDSPLPYTLDDFEDPEIARWKPNWQDMYEDVPILINPLPESALAEVRVPGLGGYSRAMLPHRKDIPQEILNTPVYKRLLVNQIKELAQLRNIPDLKNRFELILRKCPPTVFESMFAPESIPSGMAGERASRLWERLVELNKVENINAKLQKAYADYIPSIADNILRTEMGVRQARAMEKYLQLAPMISDTYTELVARICNTHLFYNEKIHYDAKYEAGLPARTFCYAYVANIIDLQCQLNRVPEDSPVIHDAEGYLLMNDPGNNLPNKRLNIHNFFKWLETQPHGWKEIKYQSHADLLVLGRQNYFVELLYGSKEYDFPNTASILRTIPQSGKYPEFLARVKLDGGPPDGEMFTPVFPTEYESNASYRTKRIFAHPY